MPIAYDVDPLDLAAPNQQAARLYFADQKGIGFDQIHIPIHRFNPGVSTAHTYPPCSAS